MRLASFHILFLCASVSALSIQSAHAQMLTGFDNPPQEEAEKQQPQVNPVQDQRQNPQFQFLDEASASPNENRAGSGFLTGFPEQPDGLSGSDRQGRIPSTSRINPHPQNAATQEDNPPPRFGKEENAPVGEKAPVDLQADSLMNNEEKQTVTAIGNVMLVQDGRILRADEISYNVPQDRIIATGNVVLNEQNGDIHTADRVELVDEMKDGFVEGLMTYLADGSRFTAEQGHRKNAMLTTMDKASYTPCEPCKKNPDKPVVWQIKASEVTHNEEENRISYRNAHFELYGIPVAYTPYFSHPDGTIERKSGFLSPTFSLDSELGFSVGNSYYWAIAPDKDATIGMRVFTEQTPLVTGEWRQRWDNASLKINSGITDSKRTDTQNGESFTQNKEIRGHIFADGLWDMNNKWRSGVQVEYASDDQYLRQYDFSSEDVLENKIYTERFSGRHYSTAHLISYQDVRIGELQNEDQPQILPEVITSWVGEPGSVPLIGGRWDIEGNILGLHREGDEQDMARASLEGAWKRRLVSDFGLLTTVDASVRGDFYEVRDRDLIPGAKPNDDTLSEARVYPLFHAETSYPLSRDFENLQMRIEPIGSISAAPHLDGNDNIPNEDSQDIQLDTANIFNANRFPGLDRVEDETHLTYGLRTGLYGHDGSTLNVFAGQSYRLDDQNNPFPAGSGLNSQRSDYVGEVYGNYKDKYYFDYRVQLDEDGLASQRHEFDGSANFGKLRVSGTYLYANSLAGTAITNSREQIGGDVTYRWNDEWTTRAGAVQDLSLQSGLRTAYVGVDHFGQCLNWSLSAVRNLTDDASGDSSTELLLRIGLKNLGEFQTSGIELASTRTNDSDDQNTINGN